MLLISEDQHAITCISEEDVPAEAIQDENLTEVEVWEAKCLPYLSSTIMDYESNQYLYPEISEGVDSPSSHL